MKNMSGLISVSMVNGHKGIQGVNGKNFPFLRERSSKSHCEMNHGNYRTVRSLYALRTTILIFASGISDDTGKQI